ncbi:MAG TPA: glycine C-acetyltransferase [Acholeplasmataceae bacterium]|jgi:glycine C-acetyltransferase|nr:glycine C-acetyltransferase [Acholeplasmataceae bacterium]
MKENSIKLKIEELKKEGVYRKLSVSSSPNKAVITLNGKQVINLCSNNYLGFANHPRMKEAAKKAIDKYGVGSGAVRTISGNIEIHEELDERLAKFKREEAALVFQSGFLANLGVIQAITDRGDLIISDELNHASIIDGVRLSRADKAVFPHSDMKALEQILKERRKDYNEVLIITDGVFSMDGDIANLPEIVRLAKKYDAKVYVDDAHGSGVLGENGRGTVDHFNLHGQVDYIMGTLSKAIGVVGAYIAGSSEMKDYLLHRGRPLLFSTSMMPAACGAAIEAITMLEETDEYSKKLWDNTKYFQSKLKELGFTLGKTQTPITPLMIYDEAKTMDFAKKLLERGVYTSGIVFPTVPKGTARIRMMLSSEHTKEELDFAIKQIYELSKELGII